MEREEVVLRNPARISRTVPSLEQLEEAAQVIANSRLPLIYAGGGVAISDAEEALVRLAEVTNIPVVTSNGDKGEPSRTAIRCLTALASARVPSDKR